MESIHKLTELFRSFPGIGPRQAKRFVYFLLSQNDSYIEDLTTNIKELARNIRVCQSCYKFFPLGKNEATECSICRDPNRDKGVLLVVAKDVDLETIEKSGTFKGTYFVLGGTLPILEKEPERKIRIRELLEITKTRVAKGVLREIILALSTTTEGEHTGDFIRSALLPLLQTSGGRISFLGRGLSTGAELEYADSETIKSALKNRQ